MAFFGRDGNKNTKMRDEDQEEARVTQIGWADNELEKSTHRDVCMHGHIHANCTVTNSSIHITYNI